MRLKLQRLLVRLAFNSEERDTIHEAMGYASYDDRYDDAELEEIQNEEWYKIHEATLGTIIDKVKVK